MSKQSHTIELNGRQYDARTGKLLPARPAAGNHKPAKPTARPHRTVDGFSKPQTSHKSGSQNNAHAVHHKTTKSQTLMRHAVKKPAPPKPTGVPKAKPTISTPRLEVDPKRLTRAKQVHKSRLVSRFGPHGQHEPIQPVASVLPVQPEPPVDPGTNLQKHHELFAHDDKHGFKKAIQHATSHTQPHPKKMSRRHKVARKMRLSPKVVNITAASLAALLLAGFIAYQNVPNLSMRIAATRAGVEGSLPGYQPAGFGLNGPIKYQPGQVTIGFKSHSDERQFQISQRVSDWNSETLLENYVNANKLSYQTYQDNGKTIYIYNDDNATWVDGGVWYQIEGNSSLSSDQLLRLAASM